jgi:uncharacterized membrane protein
MVSALNTIAVLITLLFPLMLWLGEGRIAPSWLAGLLLLAGTARWFAAAPNAVSRHWAGGAILLAMAALFFNGSLPLRFYPVLVNGALLGWFGYSLIAPPTVIERLARRREGYLPPAAIVYTRRVTQVWCLFFTGNGAVALYTALFGSTAQWSIYNGFVAYLLIGLLFAGEYCVRVVFKRRHGSTAQSV